MEDNSYSNLKITSYQAGDLQTRANRKLTTFLTSRLVARDLSLPEWTFLGILCDNGSIRMQQLAALSDVEPPFATRHINSLEKKGYITRIKDNTDSRARLIILTSSGRECVQKQENKLQKELRQYLTAIPAEELDIYVEVLEKISKLP